MKRTKEETIKFLEWIEKGTILKIESKEITYITCFDGNVNDKLPSFYHCIEFGIYNIISYNNQEEIKSFDFKRTSRAHNSTFWYDYNEMSIEFANKEEIHLFYKIMGEKRYK